jgi:sec-independent protein translocase protein TatB
MFEIGWSELLVIAIVAIVVIGPKDLPRVMRTVGQWAGKMKRMSREFQNQFNEALREAELEDVRKDVEEIGKGLREDVTRTSQEINAGLNVQPPEASRPPEASSPGNVEPAPTGGTEPGSSAALPSPEGPHMAEPGAMPAEPAAAEVKP